MPFCNDCETQLSNQAKFCSNCGSKIQESNTLNSTFPVEISNRQFVFVTPFDKVKFDKEKFDVLALAHDILFGIWDSVGTEKAPEYIWNIDTFFNENNIYHQIKESFILTKDDIEILTTSENFVQYENGNCYIGETFNNYRHGNGTLIEFIPEENKYCCTYFGNWEKDEKEGFGVQINTYFVTLKYYGNWHQNQYHGKGIFFHLLHKDEGNWVNGSKNGHCIDYYKEFIIYEGEYKDSKRNGFGICYYYESKKIRYSGLWKNGYENGYGRSFYENGALKFTGFFKDGNIIYGKEYTQNDFDLSNKLPENTAEIFLQIPYHDNETSILNIQWKKDLFEKVEQGDILLEFEIDKATMSFESHFSGVLLHKVIGSPKPGDLVGIIGNTKFDIQGYLAMLNEVEDQIIYEGDFVDEEWNGKGKLFYANGNIYEGDFIDGTLTGKGKLIYANGNIYEGDFIDDGATGKGKYTFANGNIYEGDFIDGEPTGYGKFKQSDGTYIGNFVNGLVEGYAIFIDNDGIEHIGKAENGILNAINLDTPNTLLHNNSPIKPKDGAGLR